VNNGITSQMAIEAGRKLNEAGIPYATSLILGLGGVRDSTEHVRGTIQTINQMNSEIVGTTVLGPQSGTPLYDQILSGEFELPTYQQILAEERAIFEAFDPQQPTQAMAGICMPGNFKLQERFDSAYVDTPTSFHCDGFRPSEELAIESDLRCRPQAGVEQPKRTQNHDAEVPAPAVSRVSIVQLLPIGLGC
jgi:hypothetical protein